MPEARAPAKPTVGTEHFPTPEGFERTGEVRGLKDGDWYIKVCGNAGEAGLAVGDFDRAIREILRKLPAPPATIAAMAKEAAESLFQPCGIAYVDEMRVVGDGDIGQHLGKGSLNYLDMARELGTEQLSSVARRAVDEMLRQAEAQSMKLSGDRKWVSMDALCGIVSRLKGEQ